jgi:carboxypeptidase C (cathepsin A)
MSITIMKIIHTLLESNPESAATVLWFNGGPGCSSLDGFIYEHGPFEVSKDFTTLTPREYRWYDNV